VENKDIDSLKKAKNYAFLLLKFRTRSEKEIYQRLKKKKFNEEIIKKTISFLKDKNFIDDDYFAKAWIESRLRRPLGLRRIKEELRLKGIDKEIIDCQIEKVKEGYLEEDIVLKLAKTRLSKLKGIEPQKAKSRIFSFLLRRGFSPQIVIDVINQL
jgi:regulatory protein